MNISGNLPAKWWFDVTENIRGGWRLVVRLVAVDGTTSEFPKVSILLVGEADEWEKWREAAITIAELAGGVESTADEANEEAYRYAVAAFVSNYK
jgi:hypothetical protein